MNRASPRTIHKTLADTISNFLLRRFYRLLLAGALALAFVFVGWAEKCSHFSYNSDATWNGVHTISRRQDDIKRTFETRDGIVLANGLITQFPTGAVAHLREVQPKHTIEAELREHEGKPELWMKKGNAFTKGAQSDQDWLDGFLRALQNVPPPNPAEQPIEK